MFKVVFRSLLISRFLVKLLLTDIEERTARARIGKSVKWNGSESADVTHDDLPCACRDSVAVSVGRPGTKFQI